MFEAIQQVRHNNLRFFWFSDEKFCQMRKMVVHSRAMYDIVLWGYDTQPWSANKSNKSTRMLIKRTTNANCNLLISFAKGAMIQQWSGKRESNKLNTKWHYRQKVLIHQLFWQEKIVYSKNKNSMPWCLSKTGQGSRKFQRKLNKPLPGSASISISTRSRSKLCSLKEPVTSLFESRVVYAITYAACAGAYSGQTIRHSSTRVKEHGMKNAPVNLHFQACNQKRTSADATIVDSILYIWYGDSPIYWRRYIKRMKPVINTRE